MKLTTPEIESAIRDMCDDWAQSSYENDAERAEAVLAWLDSAETQALDAPAFEPVHGPTGATIAKIGIMHLPGDGTGTFAHHGEQVSFRITMDDDESNADRYYRGYNTGYDDGYAHATAAGEE